MRQYNIIIYIVDVAYVIHGGISDILDRVRLYTNRDMSRSKCVATSAGGGREAVIGNAPTDAIHLRGGPSYCATRIQFDDSKSPR